LLELILVMLIVAVVMAMAAPSLGLFASARPVTDTAALLVCLADYARTQAIAEGRLYRLAFDLERGAVRLMVQDGTEFQPVRSEPGREFLFPAGTRAEWVTQPALQADTTVPGLVMPGQVVTGDDTGNPSTTTVTFFPDGRCQPCRLRLTDRKGNTVDVECRSPSERFRVVSPEETG